MQISYDYYRIFYHVAKYKSFTQAAAVLLNNQPNITRAVKNLEAALGCTLFIRSRKGVQLTPEGERLYGHIRIAFEQIQLGEEELALDKTLGSGSVSIGVSETALHCLLLPVLKQYRAEHPGVRIKVSNHSTPQAVAALKNGLADFALVTTPLDASELFCVTEIRQFSETAVCGAAYAFLAEEEVTLETLTHYPLICLGAQTKTYEFYTKFFLDNGLTLRADIEAATADQILPMVRNDLGIGFVPEDFIRQTADHKNLFVLSLKNEIPKRSICLLKRRDRSLTVAAKVLERMLLESVTASSCESSI